MATKYNIDSDIQKILNVLNAYPASSGLEEDIEAGRHNYLTFALYHAGKPLTMPRIEDITITSDGQDYCIPIRIYTPELDKKLPTLVYFHGGGWQRGNIATHDSICRHLAKFSGCIVASIEWRLAPENRFPIGLHDCFKAYQWLLKNGADYNIDTTSLAVGGDSAGGNIAAALLQLLYINGIQQPQFQLLLYPSLDLTCSSWSYQEFATGYFLTTERVKYYIDNYTSPSDDINNPLISPIFQRDFSYLPKTFIITAECDPLRAEAEVYADKLKQHQVDVSYQCCQGMIHAFLHFNHSVPAVRQILQDIGSVLKSALFH